VVPWELEGEGELRLQRKAPWEQVVPWELEGEELRHHRPKIQVEVGEGQPSFLAVVGAQTWQVL
jgi:hypothetical protein